MCRECVETTVRRPNNYGVVAGRRPVAEYVRANGFQCGRLPVGRLRSMMIPQPLGHATSVSSSKHAYVEERQPHGHSETR